MGDASLPLPSVDTVIVGAGPAGLCAAKTFLQCDPDISLKIFDAQQTVGGAWAKEKLYPMLKTNHHFGGVNFSDFPMQEAHGAELGKHIPGLAVYEFLSQYARHFNLLEKIEFNTRVVEITRLEDGAGWEILIERNGEHLVQQCNKLVIAIGINSDPHMPKMPGSSDFKAPILHSTQLAKNSEKVFGDELTKTVTVVGGGKSAYDAVYFAATNGRNVEWIIRKSGKGPVWVFPLATKIGPFEARREMLPARRIISFFSPCIWNDGYAWIRSWIHETSIGKFIARKFWTQVHLDTIRDCQYRTDERLKVLEPETSPFWYGTKAGAYSYEPDLFEFIKNGQVRVHREDISKLSERTIRLANGEDLKTDALILATGFSAKPTIKFNPPSLHSSLGIPSTNLTAEQKAFWKALDTKSDERIQKQFPRLLAGPFHSPSSDAVLPYNPGMDREVNYSPFRLYRSIAAPGLTANGERSFVFIGAFSNFANNARVEIQCLWAYAYLTNKMEIDEKKAFEEASLMSRYSKSRTPFGHGGHFPDHVFDQLPYFDTLIQDLGLNPWRKASALQEIFSPYEASDYQELVEEWLAKNQKV